MQRHHHNNMEPPAANVPSDTQFISSLERDDILRQSSHLTAFHSDDDDNDDGEGEDDSEDELASPRKQQQAGSAPDATDLPDSVMITSPAMGRISPVTPATTSLLAGRKRDIQGNFTSSNSPAFQTPASRTPRPNLQAFFPADQSKTSAATTLGLSQLFQQTQAATSPYTNNGPRSDPILERPSPDFRAPFQSSPPAASYSSPENVEKTNRLSSTPAPALKGRKDPLEEESLEARSRTRTDVAPQASDAQEQEEGGGGAVDTSGSDDFGTGIGKVRKGHVRASRRQFRSKRAREFITPARNPRTRRGGRASGTRKSVSSAEVNVVNSDEEELLNDEQDGQKHPAPVDGDEYEEDEEEHEVQVPMSTSRSQPEDDLMGDDHHHYADKKVENSDGEDRVAQKYQREKEVIRSSPRETIMMKGVQIHTSNSASDQSGVIKDSQSNKVVHSKQNSHPRSSRTIKTHSSQVKSSSSPLSSTLSSEAISTLRPENNPAFRSSKPGGGGGVAKRHDDNGDAEEEEEESWSNSPITQHSNKSVAADGMSTRSVDSLAPLVRAQKRRLGYSVLDTSSPVPSSRPDVSGSQPKSTSPGQLETAARTSVLGDLPRNVDQHQQLDTDGGSGQLTALASQSQNQSQSQGSPARRQAVRKLADIAGDPTPPEANENIDVNVDILNDDDKHFQAVTSDSNQKQNSISNLRSFGRASSLARRVFNSPTTETNKKQKNGKYSRATMSSSVQGQDGQNLESVEALDTENLSNMLYPSSPQANTTGKLRRPNRKLSTLKRNQSGHTNQWSFLTNSDTGTAPAAANQEELAKNTNSRSYKTSTSNTTQSSHFQPRQLEDSLAAVASHSEIIPASEVPVYEDSDAIVPNESNKRLFPQRVFARFMDRKLAYYPATCFGKVPTRPNVFRVQFDDGTDAELDVFHMRSCELRVGDHVKVDLPSMTKYTYVVQGFPEARPARRDHIGTDIFGNESVILEVRQRHSLPSTGEDGASTTTTTDAQGKVEVPITKIYFPNLLWSRLKDREYRRMDGIDKTALTTTTGSGPQTPLDGQSRAGSPPPSRARRQATTTAAASAIHHHHHASETANANYLGPGSGGIFSNMAFAITYTNETETGKERARISKLILEHGGRILAAGFEELFEPSSTGAGMGVGVGAGVASSPSSSKKSRSVHEAGSADGEILSLAPDVKGLGFTALIANTHCRRTKYMQALALNIPCLSGRWILDCVSQRSVVPWPRYLLAAGESSVLGGAVRSRTFLSPSLLAMPMPAAATTTAAATATAVPTLQEIVAGRVKLLQNKRVLIFKDKSMTDEQIKTYMFITAALGAEKVERVADIPAFRALLVAATDAKRDVVVYAKEKKLEEVTVAAATATATASLSLSSSLPSSKTSKKKKETGRQVMVVSDECIAQSLILGSLVEDAS